MTWLDGEVRCSAVLVGLRLLVARIRVGVFLVAV